MAALQRNLDAVGYPQVPGLIACDDQVDNTISGLLTVLPSVPPVLESFWRVVGGIALVDLADYHHVAFWESCDIHAALCDGVYVDACDGEWLEYAIETIHMQAEWDNEAPLLIPLSPDDYIKDNVSGGEPYAMRADGGWLAPLENFDWPSEPRPRSAPIGACDLISYLRTSLLECGGFPGLYGLEEYEPIRLRLIAGLPLF